MSISASGIGRIDEHGNASGCGHQLTQEFQPLCRQLSTEKIDPCQVAARPGEAGDKTEPDRIVGRRAKTMGIVVVAALAANAQRCLRPWRSRRPVGEPVRPPAPAADRFDSRPSGIRSPRSRPRHSRFPSGPGEMRADGPRIASGDVASRNPITGIAGCCARAASGHAAAAPPSSVMNSRRFIRSPRRRARAAPAARSRPSAFAVLRLMTVSYLVGACTGRSAGLAPRRMRST